MERMKIMSRKLVIDGNAVYEIDEDCMLRQRLDRKENTGDAGKEQRKGPCEQKENTSCYKRNDSHFRNE